MAQHPGTGGSEAVSAFPWFPVPESLLTRSCGPQRHTEWVQEAQNTDPQVLGVEVGQAWEQQAVAGENTMSHWFSGHTQACKTSGVFSSFEKKALGCLEETQIPLPHPQGRAQP